MIVAQKRLKLKKIVRLCIAKVRYFEREKIGSYQTSPKGQLCGRAYVVAVKGTQQTINSTSATAIVSKDDFGFSCLQLSEKLFSHSNAKIR